MVSFVFEVLLRIEVRTQLDTRHIITEARDVWPS